MGGVDELKAGLSRDAAASTFVQRLAARVGLDARAAAVFGEAVEREGITVIPVARATWGFGGGAGDEGSGGGGGAHVTPLGFIEVREGEASFVRIRDLRMAALGLGAAAGIIGLAVGRR